MPIPVACRSCGSRLQAPGALAGWKIKCPKCGGRVSVPNAALTAATRLGPQPARGERVAKTSRPERRPRRQASVSVPAWAWWLGGVAGFFVLAGAGLLLGAVTGTSQQLLYAGLAFLVMLPISTGILVLSMVISSRVAGGIDFGEARVVIPKAFVLLVAVNLINLVPLGFVFALPGWLIGLMVLFRLDLREARTLSGVNWTLNTLVRLLLLAGILSALLHGGFGRGNEKLDPTGGVRQAGKLIEGLGGN